MSKTHWMNRLGYNITIENGCRNRLIDVLAKETHIKTLFVLDNNLLELHRDYIALIEKMEHVTLHIVPPGETSKSLEMAGQIWERMALLGFRRTDQLIAYGGGVVGDLVGFCAANYMRGIRWIQVPTTLLAQIDSSVGGKVAINLPEGKNLIGSFYNPFEVLIDPQALKTLEREAWKSGLGEMLKYALITGDARYYEVIEFLHNLNEVRGVELEHRLNEVNYSKIEQLIAFCISVKAAVVIEDFREENIRKTLNFGHTIGHAIEAQTRYQLTHGHCVLLGMWLALILENHPLAQSYQKSIVSESDLEMLKKVSIEEWLNYIRVDKKANHEGILFVLLNSNVGMCNLSENRLDVVHSPKDIIDRIHANCYFKNIKETELNQLLVNWQMHLNEI